MKDTLLELIELRVLETQKNEGSQQLFEIDGLWYDVDYKATVKLLDGLKSGDYDVPNDADILEVQVTEVEIRNIWDADNEMLPLGNINDQFYIL